MAARDTAQLILEVDARIATAQRAVNQLARAVQQDATKMGESFKGVEVAQERVGKALGRMSGNVRSGFTQLSFQIGDVTQGLAMGTRASTIFAQQSGQVIQALQLMGGEGNKFLRFLGGPWGIAISTATVILSTLVPKLLENRDAVGGLVDKMREQAKQAALNRQADDVWKNTIEGVTEAIRQRREEQEKALRTDIQAEEESLNAARREAATLQRGIAELRESLADATIARDQIKGSAAYGRFGAATPGLPEAERRIADIKRQIREALAKIGEAEARIRGAQVPIAERNVEARVDKVKAATDAYTRTLGNLRDALEAGNITQAEFERRLEAARRKLDSVKESAKEAGKSLAPVTGGEVARALGTTIKPGGGTRTPAQNKNAGGAVNSYHLTGQAIDIPLTVNGRPLTKAGIRAALEPLGVEIKELLGPGDKGHSDHFHIAFGKKRLTPDQVAGRQAKGASLIEKAAEEALNRVQAYEAESERLDKAILEAKGQLLQGSEAQAEAALAALAAEQRNYESNLARQVADDKLNELDAAVLALQHQELTAEREKAVVLARDLKRMERRSELEQRQFEYSLDDLRFADEQARTAADHRRLQLEILDVVYQQKEAALRALKAQLELTRTKENEADINRQIADIDEKIGKLPGQKAQDTTRALQGTMGPFKAWADSIPQTEAEVTEALQRILVNGIDPLASAITDVIMGTKSLGEAFSDVARSIIAEIIQMTIRMLIFRAISGIFGGGATGGNSLGGGLASAAVGSAKGNVFSGGAIVPFARGGVVDMPTLFPMAGGRTGIMGEAGPEAVMPLARDSMGRLGVRAAAAAANNNSPIEIMVSVDASSDLMVKAALVADSRIRSATPVIVKTAVNQTLRNAGRPRLNGR